MQSRLLTVLRCYKLLPISHLKWTLSLNSVNCTDGATRGVTRGDCNLTQRAFNVHHWSRSKTLLHTKACAAFNRFFSLLIA